MDQELKMREHLSALADGQLPTEDWHQALHYAEQESGRRERRHGGACSQTLQPR